MDLWAYLIMDFLIDEQIKDADEAEKPLEQDFFESNAPIRHEGFTDERDATARYRFPPGTYLIVPSTLEADRSGEFLLRVYTHRKV